VHLASFTLGKGGSWQVLPELLPEPLPDELLPEELLPEELLPDEPLPDELPPDEPLLPELLPELPEPPEEPTALASPSSATFVGFVLPHPTRNSINAIADRCMRRAREENYHGAKLAPSRAKGDATVADVAWPPSAAVTSGGREAFPVCAGGLGKRGWRCGGNVVSSCCSYYGAIMHQSSFVVH
jgi:hypothetical protein